MAAPDSSEIRRLIAAAQRNPDLEIEPDSESRYPVIDQVCHDLRQTLVRAARQLWLDSGLPPQPPDHDKIWRPWKNSSCAPILQTRRHQLPPRQPDRDTHQIKTWSDTIVATVNWLVKGKLILPEHLPITIMREKSPAIQSSRQGIYAARQAAEGVYISAANHYETQFKRLNIRMERHGIALNRCLIPFHPVTGGIKLARQERTEPASSDNIEH